EGGVAGDYLEQLLDILDFDGDIDLDVEGDRAVVSIDGSDDLQKLVGSEGQVLEAVQELTRLAVQSELGDRSRLMLDIAAWRAAKPEAPTEAGRAAAQRGMGAGGPAELDAMTASERQTVHHSRPELDGVRPDSTWAQPRGRVVVRPW